MLAALIEHESCIGLKHSRCWNPASRLKSQREEGAGLGQLTRAWRADGSLRFDALAEMRNKHNNELYQLNWGNIYTRPDLQIRAVLLKSKDNYKYYLKIANKQNALLFGDAAYNGGISGLDREIGACKLSSTCDHKVWFNNVERFCLKSTTALYGGRSACDINRHHVKDVALIRSPKYLQFFN